MSPGIQIQRMLSRAELAASDEQQLLYVLIEATPEGLATQLPKLPLNVCLVIDRSSSMRGERLNQVKDAANKIVDQLGSADYFSLVVFNDRADVVVPAQRSLNKSDIKRAIGEIEASGGTEMANGMALALQEVQRPMLRQGISRLIVLTDGRTYGDESRCVEIARRGQERGIGITALGVGDEWNEDLLETIAAHENSHAQYIASAHEIASVFAEEIKRLHTVFAQRVQLQVAARPGGILRSMDRVRPFIGRVPIVEENDLHWVGNLGDWAGHETQSFLLEVVVPPLAVGDHPLLKLALRYDLPGANLTNQVKEEIVRVKVLPAEQISHQLDSMVKYWLERLVAYRLQSSAWQKVEAGDIEDATRRLQMAGTRLFDAGEVELARTVQEEATRLLRSGSTSSEGRKRIKFGTRGLMGHSSEARETGT